MENGSSRVALVTGAARGIGRGIALRLAADGLDVALHDIGANGDQLDGVAEEIRGAGRRTATVIADVSVPTRSKTWWRESRMSWGART